MELNASADVQQASSGRKVLQNAAHLYVGELITLVAMTLWTVIVARHVGPEIYGVYSFLGATLAVLVIFVNIGLDRLLTRDVAQNPQYGLQYLVTFVLIKLTLGVIVLGGFLVFVYATGWTSERATLALIVALIWMIGALVTLANSLLYAYEAMHYAALAQSLNALLTLGSGALAVWFKQPFSVVLWLSLSASVAQLTLGFWFAFRVGRPLSAGIHVLVLPRAAIESLLRKAAPFGAMVLVAVLYSNLIILLLDSLTHDDKGLGYFAAAQRIYSMAFIVPSVLSRAGFPVLSSTYVNARDRFAGMFERAYRMVFFVTVPMGAGLWLIAPKVLDLIYGREFYPAANTLRILSLVLLGSVVYVTGPAMEAMHRQTISVAVYGIALIGVAIAGYWAIPRYGAEGAAWALVAGAVIRLLVESWALFRWLKLRFPVVWVSKTIIASLVMVWASSLLIQSVHFLLVTFLLAPIIYGTLQLVLRTPAKGDWEYVQRLMPARAQRALLAMSAGTRGG